MNFALREPPGAHAQNATLAFRPDIEIIRGVAVLFVFLFHLLPGFAPSGFIGVDIFFVLSGYLMAAIYDPQSRTATRDFYIKRIRRILPAYFAVLLLIVVAASVLVLPNDLDDVIRHAGYSIFLIPNIGSWLDGSYFDKTIFRPTLHFWSLGVELQFYLLLPFVVWLHEKRPRLLAAIAVASFIACVVVVGIRPRYAFYLPPFRFWEFLIGLYAFQIVRSGAQIAHRDGLRWLASALLLAIVATMFMTVSETSHPKYLAAFAALGIAGVLVGELPALVVSSAAGRALLVLGRYSYSIYLVHFPVIKFWFYQPFGAERAIVATAQDILIIVLLTALLSILLFHFVERPFRKVASARILAVSFASFAIAVFGAAALAPALQQRLLPPEVFRISAAWTDRGPERCGKLAMLFNDLGKSCSLTPGNATDAKKYLLVGDSHMDAIKMAMAEAAVRNGANLDLFRENCVVGLGGCAVEPLARFVSDNNISTIVVHSLAKSMRIDDVRRLAAAGLAQTFDVVVIDPVPVWDRSVPGELYRQQRGFATERFAQTLADYDRVNANYLMQMDQVESANLRRYSSASALCLPDCQFVSPAGEPYYFDAGHLTTTGARRLTAIFESIFRGT